eukprot:860277-Rhodomonas_salina.2
MAAHHIRLLHDNGTRTLAVEVAEYAFKAWGLAEAAGWYLASLLGSEHGPKSATGVSTEVNSDVLTKRGQAAGEGADYLVVSGHARRFVARACCLKV